QTLQPASPLVRLHGWRTHSVCCSYRSACLEWPSVPPHYLRWLKLSQEKMAKSIRRSALYFSPTCNSSYGCSHLALCSCWLHQIPSLTSCLAMGLSPKPTSKLPAQRLKPTVWVYSATG